MGTGAIERVAPFMAPGFLVDGPRLFARELTRDDAITADRLAQWFADRPGPTPGSVVLVRTGWDTRWKDNRDYLGVGEGTPGVELSADGVEEFFFLAVPLRIRGGTGSPIRPLAIVPEGDA